MTEWNIRGMAESVIQDMKDDGVCDMQDELDYYMRELAYSVGSRETRYADLIVAQVRKKVENILSGEDQRLQEEKDEQRIEDKEQIAFFLFDYDYQDEIRPTEEECHILADKILTYLETR